MTAQATMPHPPAQQAGRDGFAQLVRAEWTKFRTVRGWVIGLVVAALVMAGIGLLTAVGGSSSCQSAGGGPARSGRACGPTFTVGPGGEPVTDSFYFVRQPLTGNGSITVRVTSLTGRIPPANGQPPLNPNASPDTRPGLVPWAKAGMIIKESTRPGSAYAAIMVTADHGVRMQDNYTSDTAGQPGAVSAASPRWLRLTRSGDTITGYDSADGTHWTQVGTVQLAGLPPTVQAGLFTASPAYQSISAELRRRDQREHPPQPGHRRLRSRQPVWPVAGRDLVRRLHRRRGRVGSRRVSPGRRAVLGDRVRRHRAGHRRVGRRRPDH